jgi:hypothetical protein
MTGISIVRQEAEPGREPRYQAITRTGSAQSSGRTAGEALDALIDQLSDEVSGTFAVVVEQMRPDAFFSEAQIMRMRQLMDQSQVTQLTSDEQAELEALITAELVASGRRAAALADATGR